MSSYDCSNEASGEYSMVWTTSTVAGFVRTFSKLAGYIVATWLLDTIPIEEWVMEKIVRRNVYTWYDVTGRHKTDPKYHGHELECCQTRISYPALY